MTDSSTEPSALTLARLNEAVADGIAAIRAVTSLEPAGGPADKIFPPTYQGGHYHTESRRVGDGVIRCVVLDSVQSQANRMELALKAAYERGEIQLPLVLTDFTLTTLPHIGRITALDAPHRIADAIFRDSEFDGEPFRGSHPGKRFEAASQTNATPLFELCPTALVFGVWDSTGPKGGLGAKFARALVSEIVGFATETGNRTRSRLDPLPIAARVEIYATEDGGWTFEADQAAKSKAGEPERIKPSEINLGNVTPDLARVDRDRGEPLPGGVTISHALQTAVLSIPALRRLRFPVDGHELPERNDAARTSLAALALAAIAYQRREGFDLRSRCLLVPAEPAVFELVPAEGGAPTTFALDSEAARTLLGEAVEAARELGLPWEAEIVLQPSTKLVELVRRSEEVLVRTPSEEFEV